MQSCPAGRSTRGTTATGILAHNMSPLRPLRDLLARLPAARGRVPAHPVQPLGRGRRPAAAALRGLRRSGPHGAPARDARALPGRARPAAVRPSPGVPARGEAPPADRSTVMIVGDPKPLDEVAASIACFQRVLVLGCGGCVSVCRAGGDAEAHDLARDLSQPHRFPGATPPLFEVRTIERQCEHDMLKAFLPVPEGTQAILSLACGAGVRSSRRHDRCRCCPRCPTSWAAPTNRRLAERWLRRLPARLDRRRPIALARRACSTACGGSDDTASWVGSPCAGPRLQAPEAQDRLDLFDECAARRCARRLHRGPRGDRGPVPRERPGLVVPGP